MSIATCIAMHSTYCLFNPFVWEMKGIHMCRIDFAVTCINNQSTREHFHSQNTKNMNNKPGYGNMVVCPYNKSHEIMENRFGKHLTECEKNYPDSKLVKCPIDFRHRVMPDELQVGSNFNFLLSSLLSPKYRKPITFHSVWIDCFLCWLIIDRCFFFFG